MHDPMTVAFRIESPLKKTTPFGTAYRRALITIWHVDPETGGTDDSCGWFIRGRHVNQDVLGKIEKEFLFNYKNNYWFTKDGYKHFTTAGVVLEMYRVALFQYFNGSLAACSRFLRKHLHDILHFSENPVDCIGDTINRKYGGEISEETMKRLASTIYTDIIRKTRPWYRHPRWHIHHWKIQIHWPQFNRTKEIANLTPCDDNLRETV